MLRLSWSQRGIWSALLALAGEIDDQDEEGATGYLGPADDVALLIRCDDDEFAEAVSAFTERNMLHDENDVLYLTRFRDRQSRAPSSRRAAVKERVQRHRRRKERASNEDVTTLHDDVTTAQRPVTPPDTESDTDTDTDNTVAEDGHEGEDRGSSGSSEDGNEELDPMRELIDEFSAASGIVFVAPTNQTGWREKQRLWMYPLRQMQQLCDGDLDLTRRLVRRATEDLRQNGLTVSDPNSILKKARDLVGKRNLARGSPKTRRVTTVDAQTGEKREREIVT